MKATVAVRIKVWSGEVITFQGRASGRPPRMAGVPKTATDLRYYAARVADGSGCEPRGTIPLETWRIEGSEAGPSE